MPGAKDAESRYVKLRKSLDEDLINSNWVSVDVSSGLKSNFSKKSDLTFCDVFSGAGGISLGFVKAGFRKLFSVEINPYASATIKRNFQGSKHFEMPIEEISDEAFLEFKGVDVVAGGPPCQGFSVAGFRRIDDPRNKLFLQFCRVVELLKPNFLMMENVPGILTIQQGQVYHEILKRFSDLGYPNGTVRILEAAEYGVPQLRSRAIFIANKLGVKNPYPKPTHSKENYVTIDDAIDDLKDSPRNAENNHEWTNHSKEYEKRLSLVPAGGSLYETFRDAFKRQYKGRPSMTVKENHGGTHIHYKKNRVLSARELARLQTFPDDFYFCGGMKKAYWQIGNAVPVLLARAIATGLRESILTS